MFHYAKRTLYCSVITINKAVCYSSISEFNKLISVFDDVINLMGKFWSGMVPCCIVLLLEESCYCSLMSNTQEENRSTAAYRWVIPNCAVGFKFLSFLLRTLTLTPILEHSQLEQKQINVFYKQHHFFYPGLQLLSFFENEVSCCLIFCLAISSG